MDEINNISMYNMIKEDIKIILDELEEHILETNLDYTLLSQNNETFIKILDQLLENNEGILL
jgi:hypothetical protein